MDYSDSDGYKAMVARKLTELGLSRKDMVKSLDICLLMSIEELEKIETNYNNVAVMAGWFGQLKPIYDKKLTYSKMRIIELDKAACETSDYIFNLSNLASGSSSFWISSSFFVKSLTFLMISFLFIGALSLLGSLLHLL